MESEVKQCPVFYPTMHDMRGSFEKYIESIEDQFADVGICKIVPPKEWTARAAGYDDVDFHVPNPIRQHATGRKGLFRTLLVEAKPMSVLHDMKPMSADPSLQPRAAADDYKGLEREFWKMVTYNPPLYGADVEGSLFDEDVRGWNIRKLDTILSRTLQQHNLALPGVNTPYLYFGMWRSTFAWHTEDVDLYSVNYLHYGKGKSWFCIPPAHRKRFEAVARNLLPDLFKGCPEFFRHKELLISPCLLKQHNIPVVRAVQEKGEFIINFPGGYHAGFNHGFNCAESTNFGTRRWVEIGRQAGHCTCCADTVKIDMDLFNDSEKTPPPPQPTLRQQALQGYAYTSGSVPCQLADLALATNAPKAKKTSPESKAVGGSRSMRPTEPAATVKKGERGASPSSSEKPAAKGEGRSKKTDQARQRSMHTLSNTTTSIGKHTGGQTSQIRKTETNSRNLQSPGTPANHGNEVVVKRGRGRPPKNEASVAPQKAQSNKRKISTTLEGPGYAVVESPSKSLSLKILRTRGPTSRGQEASTSLSAKRGASEGGASSQDVQGRGDPSSTIDQAKPSTSTEQPVQKANTSPLFGDHPAPSDRPVRNRRRSSHLQDSIVYI